MLLWNEDTKHWEGERVLCDVKRQNQRQWKDSTGSSVFSPLQLHPPNAPSSYNGYVAVSMLSLSLNIFLMVVFSPVSLSEFISQLLKIVNDINDANRKRWESVVKLPSAKHLQKVRVCVGGGAAGSRGRDGTNELSLEPVPQRGGCSSRCSCWTWRNTYDFLKEQEPSDPRLMTRRFSLELKNTSIFLLDISFLTTFCDLPAEHWRPIL